VTSRRVPLPRGVTPPYTVYVNGVANTEGADYEVHDGVLVFREPLVQEGGPGKGGWFLGFWGVGTYKKNDEVDVSFTAGGQPRVAHGLRLAPDDDG
jgi:hypothetical protein